MADHMYKLSEVPKGKRMQHFRDYYLFKTIIWVIVIFSVISLVKTTIFRTKPDINVLVATNEFLHPDVWDDLKEEITNFCIDYNSDKKTVVEMNVNTFDESTKNNVSQNAGATQRYMAVLAIADHLIQIVDDERYENLKSQGLIGTYKDLAGYDTGKDENEEVKIPLSELEAFDSISKDMMTEHYLTIRTRAGSQLHDKENKIENYENHVEVFASLAGFEKIK